MTRFKIADQQGQSMIRCVYFRMTKILPNNNGDVNETFCTFLRLTSDNE